VIHGRDDRTLPVQHGRSTRDWLEAIPLRQVEYHELPMGHEVTGGSLALTNAWLARLAGFPGSAGAP
jgi:predicted esterase